jgi:hypothetical protein
MGQIEAEKQRHLKANYEERNKFMSQIEALKAKIN